LLHGFKELRPFLLELLWGIPEVSKILWIESPYFTLQQTIPRAEDNPSYVSTIFNRWTGLGE